MSFTRGISGPLESGYVQLLFFVPRKVFECFWMLGEGTPAPGNEQFAVVFVWDLQHLAYGIGTEAFFHCTMVPSGQYV